MALQTTQSLAELPTWSLAERLQVTSLVGAELAPGGTEQNRCPLQAAAFAQVRSALLLEKGEGEAVKGGLPLHSDTSGARNIFLQESYA